MIKRIITTILTIGAIACASPAIGQNIPRQKDWTLDGRIKEYVFQRSYAYCIITYGDPAKYNRLNQPTEQLIETYMQAKDESGILAMLDLNRADHRRFLADLNQLAVETRPKTCQLMRDHGFIR